ncbi:nitroreductase/quinone reductase family protein [Streptomyces sp. NPDC007872]|uniref:nitroreductase/quinone reductase family protein n=1 Tax=Streptomyces sp. NPDC007872 TaxID=3364782 RepID=UPI0036D00873
MSEFRTDAGRLGGPFEGGVFLLTAGARSGREHTTPLGFVEHEDRNRDQLLVVSPAGGSDRHPGWYRNTFVNPTATVELGTETWRATAVATAPGYADYPRATDCVLPVVVFHRLPEGADQNTSLE